MSRLPSQSRTGAEACQLTPAHTRTGAGLLNRGDLARSNETAMLRLLDSIPVRQVAKAMRLDAERNASASGLRMLQGNKALRAAAV